MKPVRNRHWRICAVPGKLGHRFDPGGSRPKGPYETPLMRNMLNTLRITLLALFTALFGIALVNTPRMAYAVAADDGTQDQQGQVFLVYTDFTYIARRHHITDRDAAFAMGSNVIASIVSSAAPATN